jgi:hypothetical protein
MVTLKKYIKEICKIYGVKIRFKNTFSGGIYWKGKIEIGKCLNKKDYIDVFCHELAHFLNDIESKYPVYHQQDSSKVIKKMGIKNYSLYALKAELYTEKRGKEISKIWFPQHKYKSSYFNTSYWKGFFFGYYL